VDIAEWSNTKPQFTFDESSGKGESEGITGWQQYQFGGARNDMSLRFPHAGNQTATDQGAA
jgi:hypothetical protein